VGTKNVDEGYGTALILEDDADWGVSLKSQLHTVAEKTRSLGNVARDQRTHSPYGDEWDQRTHSPYGDEWDLLWLGNCATPPGPRNAYSAKLIV